MRLKHVVVGRVSLALILVMSFWAVFFYMTLMEEVHEEVDETLESCSELIMLKWLSGENIPSESYDAINHYTLREVSAAYADSVSAIRYADEELFMAERVESESARSKTTVFATDDGRFWELKVVIPTFEKEDFSEAITSWMIYLYVLLSVVIVSVIIWKYNKHMRPLYILLKWLEAYQVGRKNQPLDNPTNVTEFRQLNEATLAFADRNEAVFEQQKVFIGNVSHEMRTPLAVCLNRIEMLLDDDTLTEKQLSELAKTHQTLTHLSKLSSSLLLLFKIDNDQFVDESNVNFNYLLKRYLEDYEEVYAHKEVKIHWTETGTFTVHMNESLSSMLVTNLLKNAFVHNRKGGDLTVHITKRSFSISNSGSDIPLDKDKIFKRFYQQKKSERNTGLGLTIAHAICEHSALELNYYYASGKHEFRVTSRKKKL